MIYCKKGLTKVTGVVIGTIISVFAVFIVAILFGRIYLGVHSIDQVLYGVLLGSLILAYFCFVIRKPLYTYCKTILSENQSGKQTWMHLISIS